MSQEGITGRPRLPADLEPDEDAPPRPPVLISVDLSGNYQVDIHRWLSLAATKWHTLILPFVAFVITVVVCSVLCGGVLLLFLRGTWIGLAHQSALAALRGRAASDPVFDATENPLFLRLLGLTMIQLLWPILVLALHLGFALVLETLVPAPPNWLPTLWLTSAMVVTLVTSMTLNLRLWFALTLIVDQRMTLRHACVASWHLTRDHVAKLALYQLILWFILVMGASLFGVGLFLAIPFVALAEASAYLHATGQVGPTPTSPGLRPDGP